MKCLTLLSLALFSVFLSARDFNILNGGVGGNSGHSVDCGPSASNPGMYLLDYFEGMIKPHPSVLDLGPDDSPEKMALVAIQRLHSLDPVRAKRYQEKVQSFLKESDWVTQGKDIDFINDMGIAKVPENCKLRQLAVNRPFHPQIKPFLVDERLFKSMPPAHRAGLLLHEAIYSEMLALGHDNSMHAREFNLLISSRALDEISPGEYYQLTKKLFAPQFGPQFKAGILLAISHPNQFFSQNLRELLQHDGSGGSLSFHFINPLPQWLQYEKGSHNLLGTVPANAPKEIDIQIVAYDGKKSGIGVLRILVE